MLLKIPGLNRCCEAKSSMVEFKHHAKFIGLWLNVVCDLAYADLFNNPGLKQTMT